ncbi:hypothetical protein Tco_0555598 [Tanacetum coccineum]
MTRNGKSDRKCFRCDDLLILMITSKPPKDKNQRAFVGGSWSDRGEEDDEKVKNETCLVAHASSEICLGVDLEPDEWIKDSGCSKHMMGNRKLFSTYKAYNGGNVIFGSNLRGNIIGKGKLLLMAWMGRNADIKDGASVLALVVLLFLPVFVPLFGFVELGDPLVKFSISSKVSVLDLLALLLAVRFRSLPLGGSVAVCLYCRFLLLFQALTWVRHGLLNRSSPSRACCGFLVGSIAYVFLGLVQRTYAFRTGGSSVRFSDSSKFPIWVSPLSAGYWFWLQVPGLSPYLLLSCAARGFLCGVCFKTHTLRAKCRHGADFVSPPDIGDGFVCFVLYDLTKPLVPSCSQLDLVDGLLHDQHDGFTLSLLDSLFSKGLRTVKSIPPKFRLGFYRVLKGALDKVVCKPDDISCWVSLLVLPLCLLKTFCPRSNLECKSANKRQLQEESITNAIRSWGVPGGSLQLVRETLAESGPHMLDLDGEDIDLTERNLKQCKRKIYDGHYTTAVRVLSSSGVAPYNDATLQELKTKHPFMSTPSLRDSHIDHHPLIASQDVVLDRIKSFPRGNCPTVLGGYIASAPLTPLVKPSGGIRPIDVGTIWRRLVSKVSATMIGYSLDGLQFGVGVLGGGEAILHAVNHLVEDRGDDVGLSMLFVDFQNSFNLSSATLALPDCTTESTPCGHAKGCSRAWYLDDGTIVGDTLVVGKVLELITEDGPRYGLHLNIDKTELFWPKEDPRSRLEGIFPHNISRPLHGVKLLGGPVSVDVDFGSALVMKRVSKTIGLLDAVAKINDPQCELLLIRACAGVSKLYFTMRTCLPRVFELAQLSFDMALRSALERIVTASGSGFGDWQWRLATLPFAFGGLGIYSAGDVLNYAFIASRLLSATLQTKLLRDVGIVAPGSTFDDDLCVFNNAMEIDFLSNPNGLVAILKGGSHFRLAWCGTGFWAGTDYERVFIEDIYGDHAISCAGIIGLKHRHNMVCDTLVDNCFRSGISAGKEVDIGLDGGHDKKLRPADMLLYSWDGGLDVCVDLTGSFPLTQTGMSDFAPRRAVIDAAQRKRGKYMTKCADIRYGFLPFSFSSFGELKKDAVTLLKRVRNFSMAQDIGSRAASYIFNRIGFSIAKGVGVQIVSRLPSNVL